MGPPPAPPGVRPRRRVRRRRGAAGVPDRARELRTALAHAGAVLDLSVDGAQATPVVLKELVRHPVSGDTLARRSAAGAARPGRSRPPSCSSCLGAESAPGVARGWRARARDARADRRGASPTTFPDSIQHDVSEMQIGDTRDARRRCSRRRRPLLDDPETVVATLTPPRLQTEEEEEIESGDRARRRGRGRGRGRGGAGRERRRGRQRVARVGRPPWVPLRRGPSIGFSSGSATRAPSTRAHATTSASRSRACWRIAGVCPRRGPGSAAC